MSPLYGQADISGSSVARNNAIKQDLITQLELAINVLNTACKSEKLPIYAELMYRVKDCLTSVKEGLNAGDEVSILAFLKHDIYPVFNHIKTINTDLKELVEVYLNRVDPVLKVVYEAFPDRAYTTEGNLLSRNQPGAVIKDPQVVSQRAFKMAKEGKVIAIDGTIIPLEVQTLCVHGDTPTAVDLVKSIRSILKDNSVEVKPMVEFA